MIDKRFDSSIARDFFVEEEMQRDKNSEERQPRIPAHKRERRERFNAYRRELYASTYQISTELFEAMETEDEHVSAISKLIRIIKDKNISFRQRRALVVLCKEIEKNRFQTNITLIKAEHKFADIIRRNYEYLGSLFDYQFDFENPYLVGCLLFMMYTGRAPSGRVQYKEYSLAIVLACSDARDREALEDSQNPDGKKKPRQANTVLRGFFGKDTVFQPLYYNEETASLIVIPEDDVDGKTWRHEQRHQRTRLTENALLRTGIAKKFPYQDEVRSVEEIVDIIDLTLSSKDPALAPTAEKQFNYSMDLFLHTMLQKAKDELLAAFFVSNQFSNLENVLTLSGYDYFQRLPVKFRSKYPKIVEDTKDLYRAILKGQVNYYEFVDSLLTKAEVSGLSTEWIRAAIGGIFITHPLENWSTEIGEVLKDDIILLVTSSQPQQTI